VEFKKLTGHTNIGFDSHWQGNIPYKLFSTSLRGRFVNFLRMGTPTIEGLTGLAKITPEFKAYLDDLAFRKEQHLYISLQKRDGNEAGRTLALQNLQREPDRKNFKLVVLAQDSSFYKQKGRGIQDADTFKKEFFLQMLEKEGSGFYFPEKWKNKRKFQDKLKNLLDDVHYVLFSNKVNLEKQEKLDFIEVYYAYLSIFLSDYSQAGSINISCKDAIDRAGKLNSLVTQLIMIIQGKAEDPRHRQVHGVLTHAPALAAKSQAVIAGHGKDKAASGRRERLVTALEVLKDPAVRDRIRKLNITNLAGEMLINVNGDIAIAGVFNDAG